MRTLSDAIKQAQQQPSRRPYVTLKVREFVGYAPRPYWSRLYTGTEPDEQHALAIPADGSLLRLRIHTPPVELWRQRVTDPGSASDFATWTFWRSATKWCAIAQYGANLIAFAVDNTAGAQIHKAESSDSGATWSAFAILVTAAGNVDTIAAASKPDGDTVLFFSVGATLYRFRRTAGAWDASPTAWGNSVNSITGLAASYRNDWNLILNGTAATSTNPTVWQLLYGDGYSQAANTFSSLAVITPTTAGANVVFDSPFLVNAGGLEFAAYGENYTGTGGYNRPWWAHNIGDFVNNAWREPVPFNQTANNGLALAYASPYLWATTPFGVWRADISAPLLDLSPDLLAFDLLEEPFRTQATIQLRNNNKKYNPDQLGIGALTALRLGSELQLSPGYYLPAAAPAVVAGTRLYIEAWDWSAAQQDQRLILHCVGPWELLAHWRARTSYQWASADRSIFQLARFLLARAGFDYATLSSSSALVNLKPAFTLHPSTGDITGPLTGPSQEIPPERFTIPAGENGLQALRRLLDKVEDKIRFDLGAAQGVYPQSADGTDYTFGAVAGATGPRHPILSARLTSAQLHANYVQSLAGAILGEDADWNSILQSYHRIAVDQDKTLATEAEADARATRTLRQAQVAATSGSLQVPAQVAQQLYDVIAVTEPRLGLNAARRRVLSIRWTYRTSPGPIYTQELTLGAP